MCWCISANNKAIQPKIPTHELKKRISKIVYNEIASLIIFKKREKIIEKSI